VIELTLSRRAELFQQCDELRVFSGRQSRRGSSHRLCVRTEGLSDHRLALRREVHDARPAVGDIELARDEENASARSLYLSRAQEQGQRLEALVKSLLDLSRIEAADADAQSNFVSVDIMQLVREVGELVSRRRVDLDSVCSVTDPPSLDLLALNDAVSKLAAIEPAKANLVKLRFFTGLTIKQAAGILGISPRSADDVWAYARAWLWREIEGDQPRSPAR
jgi:signal transduction histidine kinase